MIPVNNNLVFKPRASNVLLLLLLISLVIGVVAALCALSLQTAILIEIYTFAVIIGIYFLGHRITEIQLNPSEKTIRIEEARLLKKSILQFDLSNVNATYATEAGAKGTLRPAFRVLSGKKVILNIVPGITGWSDKTLERINELINELKK